MNPRRISNAIVMGGVLLTIAPLAMAQLTERISVSSSGLEGNDRSVGGGFSFDGRFVSFTSWASNLVTGDNNKTYDVFVFDRLTRMTERVSVDSAGGEANSHSTGGSISADGRFIAFESPATNLVSGDTNKNTDIFVHDRQTGTTERVSVSSGGVEGDSTSYSPIISADGRFVAFSSLATNLGEDDSNGMADVFVRDRQTNRTRRASYARRNIQPNWHCEACAISADGRFVTFRSTATNLADGDLNGTMDIFVRDLQLERTERVSVDSSGAEGRYDCYGGAISADGQLVVFDTYSRFVADDTNGSPDVYVHDRGTGITERVSVDSHGVQGNNQSASGSISADGRWVGFWSYASNLVPGDTNRSADSFLHDRLLGTTRRVSVDSSGAPGDDHSYGGSISGDGRFVAFSGRADNLVSGDTNRFDDVFVHGPYLILEADPTDVAPGATITLTTWTGQPSGLVLLVVVGVDGTPMFIPAVLATFDGAGVWSLADTVPPGFSGMELALQSFGFVPTGKVQASNSVTVTFQ